MAKLNARDEAARATRELDPGNNANRSDYSEALERGLLVLTAFDRSQERLTQAQVARKLDLPRATVRRALLTLAHLGYVVADDKTYRLAPKVLDLASAYLTTNPISTLVQPVCDALANRFGTSSTAAVLNGATAVMIARALPRDLLPVGQGIGFRVPALTSALGLVLISALDGQHRLDYLRSTAGVDPTDLDDLVGKLDAIAVDGHAYVANDVETGFHSMAVPLRRWDGSVIAALNVGTGTERISTSDMHADVLPALAEAARRLQPQLV